MSWSKGGWGEYENPYCWNCGKHCSFRDNYCEHCGARLVKVVDSDAIAQDWFLFAILAIVCAPVILAFCLLISDFL